MYGCEDSSDVDGAVMVMAMTSAIVKISRTSVATKIKITPLLTGNDNRAHAKSYTNGYGIHGSW